MRTSANRTRATGGSEQRAGPSGAVDARRFSAIDTGVIVRTFAVQYRLFVGTVSLFETARMVACGAPETQVRGGAVLARRAKAPHVRSTR